MGNPACMVSFVKRAFWDHPFDASTLVKLWKRKLKKMLILTPNLEQPLILEPMFCPPLTSTTLGQSWSLPRSWCQSSGRKRHSCLLSIKIQSTRLPSIFNEETAFWTLPMVYVQLEIYQALLWSAVSRILIYPSKNNIILYVFNYYSKRKAYIKKSST